MMNQLLLSHLVGTTAYLIDITNDITNDHDVF